MYNQQWHTATHTYRLSTTCTIRSHAFKQKQSKSM